MFKRRHFLGGSAVMLAAAAAARVRANAESPILSMRNGRKALVLSGGGTRGAYQAGIISALADKAGMRDGEPFDYDLVCGTSIGALNAYLIATARYSELSNIWRVLPSLQVTQLKSPYWKIRDSSSGVLSRLAAAISLGIGLTRNKTGVLDPSGVNHVLDQMVRPGDPVHIPLYVATTNITRMRGEIFNRKATTPEGLKKQAINERILEHYSLSLIREVPDDILRNVLFASAAIPIAFDPVLLPSYDKTNVFDSYVDGGVTENVPVEIARRCAYTLDVMLVDPQNLQPDVVVDNAAEVGMAAFETMQRRMLQYQVQLAWAEAFAVANVGAGGGDNKIALEVFLRRPDEALPGRFADFDDAQAIHKMYEIGYADGKKYGWEPYVLPDPRT